MTSINFEERVRNMQFGVLGCDMAAKKTLESEAPNKSVQIASYKKFLPGKKKSMHESSRYLT